MKITDELIAEAREFLRSENAQYYDSSLIGELADALEATTRERDAVLAAIGRVREIVSVPCTTGCCDFCEGKNDGWEMVLQALDGAPEPEWEWAVSVPGDDEPFSDVYQTREHLAEQETGIAWGEEQLVRRRKAGPWLPVEGEKP